MTVVTSVLVVAGTLFALIAAVGMVRLPDLPMRMHAATKAGTLGAGLVLLAVAIAEPGAGATARALAAVVFLFLTAPVAAHLIARATYRAGAMPLWERTAIDELAGSVGAPVPGEVKEPALGGAPAADSTHPPEAPPSDPRERSR